MPLPTSVSLYPLDISSYLCLPDLDPIDRSESTEFNLDGSLADLLASPDRLESPLTTIDELQSVVSSLAHDASTLHEVVTERAAVAERISSKVRILDLEQSRVKDCIDRVQATTELKDAFVNIFRAIEKADWEAATRHIQRANSIPMNLLHSKFAEAVVVSNSQHLSIFGPHVELFYLVAF